MQPQSIVDGLEQDGIVLLGKCVADESVERMQDCYKRALAFPSWNTWIGYEQNEKWRRLVENLLLYDRAFIDLALQSEVMAALSQYIGPDYCMTEARGWETIATKRDFHGWHADAWYAPDYTPRPREVKLACYLTDVSSGHFQYVKGSHKSNEPARHWPDREVYPMNDRIVNATGPAGTCILFDTAGVHRQSIPVLQPRWVIMYNYHNPDVPLGNFATGYGRYRPLLLNAALLGGLSSEQQRVLGIGRAAPIENFHPKGRRYPHLHSIIKGTIRLRMEAQDWVDQLHRVGGALKRRLKQST